MFWKERQLQRVLATRTEDLIDAVRDLAAGADPAVFTRRPEEGAWSAAECVDHLNATVRHYLPTFSDAIENARASGSTGHRPDGRTWMGRLLVRALEPPPRLRTSTFVEVEPGPDADPDRVVAEFETLHRELIDVMARAGDLDRKKIKVRSLLDSRLKLSLDDWYAFMGAHGRRHLWQAERALEEVGGRSNA